MPRIRALISILSSVLSLAIEANSQTQLSRWYIAPSAIDFLSTPPQSFAFNGIAPGNSTFNNVCDSSGNLLFYVTFSGKIYNGNNLLLGILPAEFPNAEIAIIPNPANATDECSRKYYIISPYQTTPGDSLTGAMAYGEVNLTTGTYSTIANSLPGSTLGSDTSPIAVSRINTAGVRYLYFLSSSFTQMIPIYRVSSTGITFLNTSAYNNSPLSPASFCREMELSNAGDKLAFAEKIGSVCQVVIVSLDPTTGLPLPSLTPYVFAAEGVEVNGLEFDNSGNKLYYATCASDGTGYGVYVKNLSLSASAPATFVSGTAGYGRSMLEKSFNGSEIICGLATTSSSATVRGINASTDTLDVWSLSCALPQRYVGGGSQLVTMPDQIDGENYSGQAATLIPAITGPSTICLGTPLSFIGDDGPGTAATSQWQIQECDANGVPTNPANSYTSTLYNSPPSYYTFPTLPFVACNRHYLITLKVANSCGSDTKSVAKIITVTCPPSVDAGPDSTICEGDCATLTASGGGRKHVFTWVSFVDEPAYIGTGVSIQVCPKQTTTYCVSTVDPITGCKGTDCVTVNVEKLDPTFSLTATPVAPTYQIFTAVPTQTFNTPPGFGFVWFIDELDSVGNTVYSVNSSNPNLIPCWWSFPGSEVFDGFDGLTHSLSSFCVPTPGKFKYDTGYRITRGVWSNRCAWKQFSIVISTSHP